MAEHYCKVEELVGKHIQLPCMASHNGFYNYTRALAKLAYLAYHNKCIIAMGNQTVLLHCMAYNTTHQ